MKDFTLSSSWRQLTALMLAGSLLLSCNKEKEIVLPETLRPKITLDSETGVYLTKVGKPVTITPEVENGDGAVYSWKIDGAIVSDATQFAYTFTEQGSVFVTLRVDSRTGSDETEMRIDVSDLARPLISLVVPDQGVNVVAGRAYLFDPDVQNGEGAIFAWILDGEVVGTESSYTFLESELGTYELVLEVTNEDGADEKSIRVNVVETIPVGIEFVASSRFADPGVKTASKGRPIYLRPVVENAVNPTYSWELDGEPLDGETSRTLVFIPQEEKEYEFTLIVTDTDPDGVESLSRNITRTARSVTRAAIKVECFGEEASLSRPTTGQKRWNRVYEYLPAPGQFINETRSGFTNVTTMDAACTYAGSRLESELYVSLGGFGGYMIVGFDHSIPNKGGYQGYDFSISGNQFEGSSEPGIVWVMQDVNGNGLPDDEWYELRGSETGKPETIREYAVTYTRPAGPAMDARWTDNRGRSGSIDYLSAYHTQDYYYPLWVETSSYTLRGTCLQHRTAQDPATGFWYNGEYDWGYADNVGSDRLTDDGNTDAGAVKTYFKIENAMYPDGTPAGLQFIDFIKVQTGVNTKAGWLGEVSTEVFGFEDENL